MHTITRWRPVRPVAIAASALIGLVLAGGPAVAQDDDEASGAQTWSVQPADEDGADGRAAFEYELEPGERVDDFAQVNNFGEQALTFRVYSHDALNTPEGAFTLQPADVEPEQVGVWVGLDEQVTVEPGGSAVVPFTLAVPDDATPGDHAGGIVASVTSEETDDEGNQVLVDNRVGSRIYLRVAGELDPVLAVEVVDANYERSWVPFSSGELTVTYVVRNVGNIRLGGEQDATVSGLFGLGEQGMSLGELREVLPSQQVTTTAQVDGVAPLVRFTGEVSVNPLPPEPTGAEIISPVLTTAAVAAWAIPWPELIILALIALGVWWSWWRRRQRKGREKTMVEEAVAKAREEMRHELQTGSAAENTTGAEAGTVAETEIEAGSRAEVPAATSDPTADSDSATTAHAVSSAETGTAGTAKSNSGGEADADAQADMGQRGGEVRGQLRP